jgi:hypothetical protein
MTANYTKALVVVEVRIEVRLMILGIRASFFEFRASIPASSPITV